MRGSAVAAGTLLVATIGAAIAGAAGPAVKHTKAGSATATKSLVTLKALGKGWTASKTAATGLQLSCNGYSPSGKGIVEIGSAGSPTFSAGQIGPFIVQTTAVYASKGQAATLWSRAIKPGLITCVAQSLQTLTSKGIKVKIDSQGGVQMPTVGDQTAEYRVAATLTSKKQKALKTFFDVVFVRVGQTITEITFSSFVSAVPTKVEQALALVAARHLGARGAPVA